MTHQFHQEEQKVKKPYRITPALLKYWESMRGKKGEGTPRWKGELVKNRRTFHEWISKHYGDPKICENPACEGKATWFDWCLKKGHTYSHNREDYLRMCRSCHRKYDWLEKTKKDLWYNKDAERTKAVKESKRKKI